MGQLRTWGCFAILGDVESKIRKPFQGLVFFSWFLPSSSSPFRSPFFALCLAQAGGRERTAFIISSQIYRFLGLQIQEDTMEVLGRAVLCQHWVLAVWTLPHHQSSVTLGVALIQCQDIHPKFQQGFPSQGRGSSSWQCQNPRESTQSSWLFPPGLGIASSQLVLGTFGCSWCPPGQAAAWAGLIPVRSWELMICCFSSSPARAVPRH